MMTAVQTPETLPESNTSNRSLYAEPKAAPSNITLAPVATSNLPFPVSPNGAAAASSGKPEEKGEQKKQPAKMDVAAPIVAPASSVLKELHLPKSLIESALLAAKQITSK
jgi:hypothetical protein